MRANAVRPYRHWCGHYGLYKIIEHKVRGVGRRISAKQKYDVPYMVCKMCGISRFYADEQMRAVEGASPYSSEITAYSDYLIYIIISLSR